MERMKEKRTANFRSKPTKQPVVIVMPERETPGQSAMACPMPTTSASLSLAVFSVLPPRRTRSLTKRSTPVKRSAPPIKYILSLRPSKKRRNGTMTKSGSVPTMTSNIMRRAGGTTLGVVWWTRSPTPAKNSTIIS